MRFAVVSAWPLEVGSWLEKRRSMGEPTLKGNPVPGFKYGAIDFSFTFIYAQKWKSELMKNGEVTGLPPGQKSTEHCESGRKTKHEWYQNQCRRLQQTLEWEHVVTSWKQQSSQRGHRPLGNHVGMPLPIHPKQTSTRGSHVCQIEIQRHPGEAPSQAKPSSVLQPFGPRHGTERSKPWLAGSPVCPGISTFSKDLDRPIGYAKLHQTWHGDAERSLRMPQNPPNSKTRPIKSNTTQPKTKGLQPTPSQTGFKIAARIMTRQKSTKKPPTANPKGNTKIQRPCTNKQTAANPQRSRRDNPTPHGKPKAKSKVVTMGILDISMAVV